MFRIYKKVGVDLYDFTDLCGNLTFRSEDSEISEEVNFIVKGTQIAESDIILVKKDGIDIYEGIVTTVEQSQYTKNVRCFDFGWYLNKNEEAYQFNCIIDEALEEICNDFDIEIGFITSIPIHIKKVVRGKINTILNNLITYAEKSTGTEYVWEMRNGKFYVEKLNNNVVVYNTDLFGAEVDITTLMQDPIITKSIENMKNAVKVINQKDNGIKVVAYSEDLVGIKKRGKVQKIEFLAKKDNANAKNVADGQLKLLNKVETTFPVTLPGVIECRANKVLQFDDDIIGIKGKFRVKRCRHNINATSHTMDLGLELI